MDWYCWRLYLSEKIRDSKADIDDRWSMSDAVDAHLVLDVIEDADALRAISHGKISRDR